MRTFIQDLKDMSDSREVFESRPHSFTSIFIYILILIIIIALVWSYFGEMEEYVKATGVVRPGENISTIRNLVAGRVEKVNLEEGVKVMEGETLFVIETDTLLVEKNELMNILEKLERERENLLKLKRSLDENTNLFDGNSYEQSYFYNRFLKFESDMKTATERFEQAMLDLQKAKVDVESSISLAKERLTNTENEKQNELALLKSAENGSNQIEIENTEFYAKFVNYELTLSKLTMTFNQKQSRYERAKRLYEIGGIPRREVDDARVQKETTIMETNAFKNEFKINLRESIRRNIQIIREANDTITSLEQRLILLNQNQQSAEHTLENIRLGLTVQIEEAVKSNQRNIEQTQTKLKSIEINIDRASVKASISGTLHLGVSVNNGDFLYSGMMIGTIIPYAAEEFEIQLMVANEDIADIKEGQKIKYRLHAFPFHEYGDFEGYVRSIGADARVNPESGMSYFVVEASINTQDRPQIRVGMVSEARLVTRTRKIILWFFERINLID